MDFSLLLVALVAAIVAIAWGRKRIRTGIVHRCLARQAEKRGGTVRPATWLRFPELTLPGAGADAVFLVSALPGGNRGGIFATRRPAQTFAQVAVDGLPEVTLEVRSRSRATGARLETTFGGAGLATGDAAFDDRFTVRSGNADWALAVLDDGVRHRLRALGATADVHVTVDKAPVHEDGTLALRGHRPRLDVSLGVMSGDDADYDRLIEATQALRERLLATA